MHKCTAVEEAWSLYLQRSAHWHSPPRGSAKKPTPKPAVSDQKLKNWWKTTSTKCYIEHPLLFSNWPKRCKSTWFWPPGVTFSQTWKHLPATERKESWNSRDNENTSGKTYDRKRGKQPTQRLNKRKHGQNQHSDEHHMASRTSPKSQSITLQLNLHLTALGWCNSNIY